MCKLKALSCLPLRLPVLPAATAEEPVSTLAFLPTGLCHGAGSSSFSQSHGPHPLLCQQQHWFCAAPEPGARDSIRAPHRCRDLALTTRAAIPGH